jgi:hypothetical protein
MREEMVSSLDSNWKTWKGSLKHGECKKFIKHWKNENWND